MDNNVSIDFEELWSLALSKARSKGSSMQSRQIRALAEAMVEKTNEALNKMNEKA